MHLFTHETKVEELYLNSYCCYFEGKIKDHNQWRQQNTLYPHTVLMTWDTQMSLIVSVIKLWVSLRSCYILGISFCTCLKGVLMQTTKNMKWNVKWNHSAWVAYVKYLYTQLMLAAYKGYSWHYVTACCCVRILSGLCKVFIHTINASYIWQQCTTNQ